MVGNEDCDKFDSTPDCNAECNVSATKEQISTNDDISAKSAHSVNVTGNMSNVAKLNNNTKISYAKATAKNEMKHDNKLVHIPTEIDQECNEFVIFSE